MAIKRNTKMLEKIIQGDTLTAQEVSIIEKALEKERKKAKKLKRIPCVQIEIQTSIPKDANKDITSCIKISACQAHEAKCNWREGIAYRIYTPGHRNSYRTFETFDTIKDVKDKIFHYYDHFIIKKDDYTTELKDALTQSIYNSIIKSCEETIARQEEHLQRAQNELDEYKTDQRFIKNHQKSLSKKICKALVIYKEEQ